MYLFIFQAFVLVINKFSIKVDLDDSVQDENIQFENYKLIIRYNIIRHYSIQLLRIKNEKIFLNLFYQNFI